MPADQFRERGRIPLGDKPAEQVAVAGGPDPAGYAGGAKDQFLQLVRGHEMSPARAPI